MLIDIESEEQFDEILRNEVKDLVVLDFVGATCGPCRKLAPLIEEVSNIYEDIPFCRLEAPKMFSVFARYQVSSVPCILILKLDAFKDLLIQSRLILRDITKDNLIGLISEYKNKSLR